MVWCWKEAASTGFRLDYCYIDHNKHIKKKLAGYSGSVAQGTSDDADHTQLEMFDEILRGYTDMFTKIFWKQRNLLT